MELTGIIAKPAQKLRPQFRNIDTAASRIELIEAGSRLLAAFDPKLSDYAAKSPERRRGELRFGAPVTGCPEDG